MQFTKREMRLIAYISLNLVRLSLRCKDLRKENNLLVFLQQASFLVKSKVLGKDQGESAQLIAIRMIQR